MNKILIFCIIVILASCRSNNDFSVFRNGDIIFQTSRSSQSKAIQIATKSKYSHVGIIYKKDGSFYVFEAVQPVKLTPLKEWISRGEKGHFVVKRIKDYDKLLTPGNLNKMKQIGDKYIGKDYDLYFDWSDKRMYCSELVWKVYKKALGIEVGKLETLGDFDLSNSIVKQKLKERYGNNIPMDEVVISPAAIFNSKNLFTVFQN